MKNKKTPNWVKALTELTTNKEISDISKEIDGKGISTTLLSIKLSNNNSVGFSSEQLELLEKVAEKIALRKHNLINEILGEKTLFSLSELQKYSGFIEFLFRVRLVRHIKEELNELTKEKSAPQIIINLAVEKYIELNQTYPHFDDEKQFVEYKGVYYFNFVKIMQYQTAITTAQGTILKQDYHENFNIL